MKLENRLQARLELKLKPMPLLVMEAKLMEIPLFELEEAIIKEVESNPMLEFPDQDSKDRSISSLFKESKYLHYEPEISGHPMSKYEDEETSAEELVEAPPISVWDRLSAQIDVEFSDAVEKKIANAILDNLDGKGFLTKSEESLAEKFGLKLELVRKVRSIFVNFDPFGAGSLSLKEFLLLQLLSRSLITRDEMGEYLNEVDEEKLKRILSKYRINYLLYPFSLYEEERSTYIVPEVIFKIIEGSIVVELYESSYINLSINKNYEMLLKSSEVDHKVKNFLKQKYNNALRFREFIIKRRLYLRKIAEYIALKDAPFIMGEVNYTKPESQRRAAEHMGIPVWTFNRILKEKYVDTPRGIFSLRFFFKKGIKTASEPISRNKLDEMIKELIEEEDKRYPVSDQEIAAILNQRGISIKRRTVALARQKLGIPASFKRKIKA